MLASASRIERSHRQPAWISCVPPDPRHRARWCGLEAIDDRRWPTRCREPLRPSTTWACLRATQLHVQPTTASRFPMAGTVDEHPRHLRTPHQHRQRSPLPSVTARCGGQNSSCSSMNSVGSQGQHRRRRPPRRQATSMLLQLLHGTVQALRKRMSLNRDHLPTCVLACAAW